MPDRHHRQEEIKSYRKAPGRQSMIHLHRARAEAALGHGLPPRAVVHHADGTRSDDGPLVICQNQAYHLELHRKMRIQALGGNPWTQRICAHCGLQSKYRFADDKIPFCYGCAKIRRRKRTLRERAA